MSKQKAIVRDKNLFENNGDIRGYASNIAGEEMYCIENFDQMDPFLMTIVSSSDLWMYLSSKGSLTAGRGNCNNALFPYDTDDKIHLASEHTGPKTIIRIRQNSDFAIWEPFSNYYKGFYKTKCNLYKNKTGNKITFTETNYDLQVSFGYTWMNSEELGWIRKCFLENISGHDRIIDITDGLQNIIPYGASRDTMSSLSTLIDAYKVSEWLPDVGLALYRMSSIPLDRPEPNEALKANTIWSYGLTNRIVMLTSKQLDKLRFGGEPIPENLVYGQKTSFFVHDRVELINSERKEWYIIADVSKDHRDIVSLKRAIAQTTTCAGIIESSVHESSEKLNNLVKIADGIQHTGDKLNDYRHFANTMFNIMRGGVFTKSYIIDKSDFLAHLYQSSKSLYHLYSPLFEECDESVNLLELLTRVIQHNHSDLIRLTYEYLPLSFSRRHGDPSRPWNFFDIRLKTAEGKPLVSYQGNWRDIFQNWEALAISYPYYLPGMICKFLNASTVDGYNPYRITREGFDWEVPEPENPWAFIGYWGDHQVIYLLRLMELSERFFPGELYRMLEKPIFVYANVPYRIKEYREILENPKDTIIFDVHLHKTLIKQSTEQGSDGKLLQNKNGIVRASFSEKILVSLLTKLSNFIPEAGIWLNTQRPEWNDANNALVGNGASMVTLYHLRRYVSFLKNISEANSLSQINISKEVGLFFEQIENILEKNKTHLVKGFCDESRKQLVDQLGMAGEDYRKSAYNSFTGEYQRLPKEQLINLYNLILQYLDHSIAINRRNDGLYHSYNLVLVDNNRIKIQHLDVMLEGQVAFLNSGLPGPGETLKIIKTLFSGKLYRKDQGSFMLYPFKELPGFMQKNKITEELIQKSSLLRELILRGNTQIVNKDAEGFYHFNGTIVNARELKTKLLELNSVFEPEHIKSSLPLIMEIYESVFNHRLFTGRSGSFYKYEGIGSIYWHMVSKLLLALGENIMRFADEMQDPGMMEELKFFYYKIKDGIGTHKNPKKYGAFPTDPYSHTPLNMGAQQPGLTGQVKEDVLSRFNELGIMIRNGMINFSPVLIREEDFNDQGEIRFTFCHTPFLIKKSLDKGLIIHFSDKTVPLKLSDFSIPASFSEEIMKRSGWIKEVVCYVQ